LNGSSYTEHVDFGDRISAGIVGKDQQFKVKIDGDTFVQAGTLSNGRGLSETWKRVNWFADTLAFSFLGVVTGVGGGYQE